MAAKNITTHGHNQRGKRSKTYSAWRSMMQRCNNKNNPAYVNYGGRGISVCDAWHDFRAFLFDMGEVPSGLTLERKNNALGYAPDNCLWASRKEQVLNRRNTFRVEFQGEVIALQLLADQYGIKAGTVKRRLKNGCNVERALTSPVMTPSEVGRLGNQKTLPLRRQQHRENGVFAKANHVG